jgi:RNA polymerase sigma factor (sigma-70 family)
MEHENARPDDADDDAMTGAATALDNALLEPVRDVPASMDAFLAQVERRAWRMAELNLGHREDAMDAVQDAMLRLVKHYSGKPAEEWTPLFWGILRRRIVDLQRRRKVRSVVVGWLGGGRDDEGDDLPAWEPADPGPDPLARLQDSQAYADIAVAVRALPRRQREAFMFRVLEGLDVAETAAAMTCSEGSVKTHLSRAMHNLRDQLEKWR